MWMSKILRLFSALLMFPADEAARAAGVHDVRASMTKPMVFGRCFVRALQLFRIADIKSGLLRGWRLKGSLVKSRCERTGLSKAT